MTAGSSGALLTRNPFGAGKGRHMDTGVVIGMDPHKRTVTIEVMDAQEHVLGHEQIS